MREIIVKLSAILLALSVIITSVTFAPRGSIVTALDNAIIENTSIDRESILATVGYLLCLCDEDGCNPEEPNESCPNCSQGKECRYGAEPECVCEEECDPESDEENECPHCSIEGNECQFEEDDTPDEDDDTPDGDDDSLDEDDDDDTPDEDEDELPPLELTSQFEYDGKTYADGDTIEIAHEEKITLNVSIPAENEGGVFAIDIPKGLELTSVAYTPASVTAVASTFIVKTTLSNSYNVVAGEENTFAITVGIDPFLMSYADEVEVGSIELVYTDSTGEEVATTSIGVDLTSYIVANSAPSSMSTPNLSISTSYGNTWYGTADGETSGDITVTNDDYIRVKASLAGDNDGGTLTFTIPTGFVLVSAPGYNKDFLKSENVYIDVENSMSGNFANNKLTYKVFGSSISDISVYVKIDTNYVNYANNSGDSDATTRTQDFGKLTVQYETETAVETPNIKVQSNIYDLSLTSMNAVEKMDTFLGTATGVDNTLLDGLSDTVNVTTTVSIKSNFLAAKTIQAQNLVLTINVPKGSKISQTVGTLSTAEANTVTYYSVECDYERYTLTIAKPSFSLSSGYYSYVLNNFMSVQFPYETFALKSGEESATYYIRVEDFSVEISEYDWDNNKFAYVKITDTIDFRHSPVVIEKYEDRPVYYWVIWGSYQGNVEVHNPQDGLDQLLFKAKRSFSSSSAETIDLPITIEYNQNKVTENGVEDYLDDVNKVVMAVPLLANVDRYSASIKQIDVEYADGDTVEYTEFKGWNKNEITGGYYPSLSSTASSGSFTAENFKASYTCNTIYNSAPTYSNLTIEAPAGKSIVRVKAYFIGDNETYTDGNYYVYGIPLSDTPTTNHSQHWFSIQAYDKGDYDFEAPQGNPSQSIAISGGEQLDPYGFKWKENIPFELTIAKYSYDEMSKVAPYSTYTFNTAFNNMKLQISNWINNPRGYLDLAIFKLSNATGSDTDYVGFKFYPNEGIVNSSDITDIVTEIMFPYNNYGDKSQISYLEYKYNEDDYVYVYNEDFHGVDNAPFYVAKRSVYGENSTHYANSSAYMTAPSGKSFEYIIVEYNSWGVTKENRYVMFKGYLDPDKDVNSTNGKVPAHRLFYKYDPNEDFGTTYSTIGKNFIDISSEQVGVDILNTTAGNLDSVGLVEYNTLVAGRTNTLQYKVYAGSSVYSDQGYRAIAFDVILPESMSLVDAYATESFSTMYSSSTYNSYFTPEKVGAVTITNKDNPDTITDHFGVGIDGKRYRVELDDKNVRLYGFYSFKSPYGLNQTCFTLTLDVMVDAGNTLKTIPQNKVFFMGSTAHKVTLATSGYSAGDGKLASIGDGHGFGSNNAVTAKDDIYLYVDSFPFVSVHSAHVKIDGDDTEYYYKAGDSNSIAVFDEEGQEGSINFSITNTVDFPGTGSVPRVAYVYFPLPISDNPSDLVSQLDFTVSLNTAISLTGTTTGVELKYRNLPSQTNVINMDEVEKDWGEASSTIEVDSNTLIVKLTDFGVGSTVNVSIPIVGPTLDDILNTTGQYEEGTDLDQGDYSNLIGEVHGIGLSGISIFNTNLSNDTSIYFGGNGPDTSLMSVNPEYIGKNPVYFEFDHKSWEVDFKAMLTYTTSDNSTVITELPQVAYNDTYNVFNKKAMSTSGWDEEKYIEYEGYEFVGWYTSYHLTDSTKADKDTIITADTTLYAKYISKYYNIYYENSESTTPADRIVSWDRLNVLPENYTDVDAAVDGKKFIGWSIQDYIDKTTKEYDETKIISSDMKYNEVSALIYPTDTESQAYSKGITLYAIYEDTLYSVYYDVSGSTPLTGVKWEETDLIQVNANVTQIGKTLIGWGLTSSSSNFIIQEGVTRFCDLYHEYLQNYNGIDNQAVTLTPFYKDTEYPIMFTFDDSMYTLTKLYDASGNEITNPYSVLNQNTYVTWTSRVFDNAPVPYIDGKIFVGWSLSIDNSNEVIDKYTYYYNVSLDNNSSDEDTETVIKFYPHFEDREYTVIYDFNASTYAYAPEPQTKPDTVKWGESVWDKTQFHYYGYDFITEGTTQNGTPSGLFHVEADSNFKTMYRFEGWYTTPNYEASSKIYYNDNDIYKSLVDNDEQETLTLYAKYEIVHYAIFYIIDEYIGGSPLNEKLADADYQYLKDNVNFYERGRQEPDTIVIPQKVGTDSKVEFIEKGEEYYDYDYLKFNVPGYEWHKWEAGTTIVDDGDDYEPTITSDLDEDTLYYEIYGYDSYTYSSAVTSDVLEPVATILSQFTPKYYNVSYLSTDNYAEIDSTLTANGDGYYQVDNKVVTWQGGDLDVSFEDMTTISEKDGYKFIGWYTSPEPDETDEPITDLAVLADFFPDKDDTNNMSSDLDTTVKLELYAVYSPLTFKVYYDVGYKSTDSNDTNGSLNVRYLEIEDDLYLPVLEREGYTFNGWYADFDYTTQVPSNNSQTGMAWTFEDYYTAVNSEKDTDGNYIVITIPEDASVFLYGKWSLSITLGITNQEVLFTIEEQDSIGRIDDKSYLITNHSKASIYGTQYVSIPNSDWELVEDSIFENYDPSVDEEVSIDMLEEFAQENGLTIDEAMQVLEELGLLDEVLEAIETTKEKSQMYVHLTGYQYLTTSERGEPFFELALSPNLRSISIIQENCTVEADIIFEYYIKEKYEGGDEIDLFHIDYKFGLD